MIHARLSDAVRWTGAEHIGPDVEFYGVDIDSRRVRPGSLFVALMGAHHDGHKHLHDAQSNGAVAALVTRPMPASSLPLLLAEEAVWSLGALAANWRQRFQLPVIAVLGSNGKTTVKELIAGILRQQHDERILVTQGNQNNAIGLPLTLFRLNEQHQAAVVELGASGPGEIMRLGEIALPNVVVITNAGLDHIAGFGGIDGAARANGEVFSTLLNNGIAVLNGDDDCLPIWRQQAAHRPCLSFGFNSDVDVRGHWRSGPEGNSLIIDSPWGRIETRLHLMGKHNALNALAAAAVCLSLGIEPDLIDAGLRAARPVAGRLQFLEGAGGAQIIDDTYNANPSSLTAALDTLAALPGKKIVVLGDMAELGIEAETWHRHAGKMARSMGIEELFTIGELATYAAASFGKGGQHLFNGRSLIETLRPRLHTGVTVLVKGSRCMAMEHIVSQLLKCDP